MWRAFAIVTMLASTARAQPAVAEEPEPTLRLSIGGGTSGTVVETHDQRGSLVVEFTASARINPLIAIGLRGNWTERNWAVIRDVYATATDGYTKTYGFLAGTGLLAGGPDLIIGPSDRMRPWASVGMALFVFIDTRPPSPMDHTVWGNGATAAVGYDFGPVGVSVHGMYAPSSGAVLGTTGPSVATLFATIDYRFRDTDPGRRPTGDPSTSSRSGPP